MLMRAKIELLRRQISQRELASAVGVHASRVSRILRGHVRPRPRERARIARLLGVRMWELFPDIGRGRLGPKRAKGRATKADNGGAR